MIKREIIPKGIARAFWISWAVLFAVQSAAHAQAAQEPEATTTAPDTLPTAETPTAEEQASSTAEVGQEAEPTETAIEPAATTAPAETAIEPAAATPEPAETKIEPAAAPAPQPPPLFKPGLLLQTWARIEDLPAGEEFDTRFTLYMRRIRILLSGQINDLVNYFAETDNPNFGKYGDFAPKMFIQDAWVELNVAPEFQLDIGMLLLPFSHQGMQGATTLNALDYHVRLIRYPISQVWRDMGVMARGLLFDNVLEYRLAVTNGAHPNAKTKTNAAEASYPSDPRNPKDWPRLTARLVLNAFEPEGVPTVAGFFYKGAYLKETPEGIISAKKVLALGGSVDWQKGVNVSMQEVEQDVWEVDETKDYFAAAADVFAEIPLSDDKRVALTGQVNFYFYNHGDRKGLSFYDLEGNKDLYSGVGIASELGLRYDAIEPIISLDWFNSSKVPDDAGEIGDYLAVYGGINYFWMAHALTFKLEVGAQKEPRLSGSEIIDKFAPFGTIQSQFLF
ncbi:MAG: hypothetical protein JXA30_10975 [Deltaproteobacteria bacterium]|nr:hypothetical protein [Deltaproteobacteria bacterium]